MLRRFHQPVERRVWSDLKDSSGSPNAQTLRQAGEHAHDEFDLGLFAMEDGTGCFQKVALTCRAVDLAPGAATGMTVGAEIPQPEPAPIGTIAVRTKVPG